MRGQRVSKAVRFVLSAAVLALGIAGSPGVLVAGNQHADPPAFDYIRAGSPLLVDARQWVLRGVKQSDGSCRYSYPRLEREIPENGWISRSIGINMANCTKLMEEGSPAEPLVLEPMTQPGGESLESGESPDNAIPTAPQPLAASSTRGAWQMVSYLDIFSLTTNRDRTQIYWTYNGSSVLSGNAEGWWWWWTFSGWTLVANSNKTTQKFEADGAFRGQTVAIFRNSQFCAPSPTTYTYIYYNRVWGHANGTATIAQSSDTVNDCLPLHVDVTSGYN